MYFYDRKMYRRRKKYAWNESIFSQKLFITKISEEEIIRVLYYARVKGKSVEESLTFVPILNEWMVWCFVTPAHPVSAGNLFPLHWKKINLIVGFANGSYSRDLNAIDEIFLAGHPQSLNDCWGVLINDFEV